MTSSVAEKKFTNIQITKPSIKNVEQVLQRGLEIKKIKTEKAVRLQARKK